MVKERTEAGLAVVQALDPFLGNSWTGKCDDVDGLDDGLRPKMLSRQHCCCSRLLGFPVDSGPGKRSAHGQTPGDWAWAAVAVGA